MFIFTHYVLSWYIMLHFSRNISLTRQLRLMHWQKQDQAQNHEHVLFKSGWTSLHSYCQYKSQSIVLVLTIDYREMVHCHYCGGTSIAWWIFERNNTTGYCISCGLLHIHTVYGIIMSFVQNTIIFVTSV